MPTVLVLLLNIAQNFFALIFYCFQIQNNYVILSRPVQYPTKRVKFTTSIIITFNKKLSLANAEYGTK